MASLPRRLRPPRRRALRALAPLGFELRQAASGHDALDLLATGYRPDAVFMDLAMPGIDGWETLRRIRAMQVPAHCAIVSANAFDKGLDNDVAIGPGDFFVKPVRHTELLDWLEQRLELVWHVEGEPASPPMQPAPAPATPQTARPQAPMPALAGGAPPRVALAALEQAVALGYPRGVMQALQRLEQAHPECAAWLASMREQARQFQFEAMGQWLEETRTP